MKTTNHLALASLLILSSALVGCDQAVRNFVRNTNPPTTGREPDSVTPVPQQISIGPGSVDAQAANLRLKARLTTTDRPFSMGSDRKATISIGRQRNGY